MIGKYLLAMLCILCMATSTNAQKDTLPRLLDEVVISANKWEQELNEIPNKIIKINKGDIILKNPQTSADLLSQSGAVFIQKSQLGGGSPMIRGFATNRVLLVLDGVRMNNAIYRSGNLQNVISIDPLSIENAEVIFGPGSLIYGSDAIGGVMDFHTLEPKFSKTSKTMITGSALARYSSANNENTIHADVNAGWKKWSVLSSITYSSFEDLKMGKNGGQDRYLRPEYVIRENNTDVIVQNADSRVQKFSGYNQVNFLQKIKFKPSEKWDLEYSFNYAGTGDAPRYDRLIQYRNGALRFAEWYYDDMLMRMHNFKVMHSKKTAMYDRARIIAGYQSYEEARIDRTRNNNNRNKQVEQVGAFSTNFDANKIIEKGELFYGAEFIHNKVSSFGERTNISNNSVSAYVSRYPDGSKWQTMGVYGSYKINLFPKLTLLSGLRYSYNSLDAEFVTTFIDFPYEKAEIRDGALTGNAGLVYRPSTGWQINGNISTGYRMPNVDDIGKLFESVPGKITVPNPNLTPEYAWNFEAGFSKSAAGKYRASLHGFYTILDNAIVRRPFTFNGDDSLLFDGVLSRVEALQNVAKATVKGIQANAEIYFCRNFTVVSFANWISGKETDDVKNEQVPLRHAPPFYGSTHMRYRHSKFNAETSVIYNSKISSDNMAPSEIAKPDIYAVDENGNPYSPGWYTLNFKAGYQLFKNLLVTAGWENMTNQRYRPYSSGIVAGGSNIILSIRASL